MSAELERARSAYAARRWVDAFEAYLALETEAALDSDDLDRLVWAAALTGDDASFIDALERLHRVCVAAGRSERAARAAFWIGFRLFALGEPGRAAGWLARAERLLEDAPDDCAERGYLLLPSVYRHLGAGEDAAAEALASRAGAIGEGAGERDLVALARNLEGRASVRQHAVDRGMALLDEVMVAATSGELSPLVTGLVYCNVIETCHQAHALDRAREWTNALAAWCDAQPQLVTFTGYCLVHRSEALQLGGQWAEALDEVTQVCDRVRERADPEVFGDACYQRAELLRLRGDDAGSEAAYRLANDNGRDPQPGLALLRLSQGRIREAKRAMGRVMVTTRSSWGRARVLPAFVEIALRAGDLNEARTACDELSAIADGAGTDALRAVAAHAQGAVLLAEGKAESATEQLRRAFAAWNRIGAPYEAARIRVTLALAYEALGDRDGAKLERDSARRVFTDLGATPDLHAMESDGDAARSSGAALSPREREVLQLLAQGMTNRAISEQLFVSERTVHRHVSNIFGKIDVSSRAEATAYAYEHGLV